MGLRMGLRVGLRAVVRVARPPLGPTSRKNAARCAARCQVLGNSPGAASAQDQCVPSLDQPLLQMMQSPCAITAEAM